MSARERQRREAQRAASLEAQHGRPRTKSAKSIAEFCDAYGISHPTVYAQIELGRLKTIKVGRRRLITAEQERAWLELCEQEASA